MSVLYVNTGGNVRQQILEIIAVLVVTENITIVRRSTIFFFVFFLEVATQFLQVQD